MALVGTLLFCEDCGSLLDRHPPEQRLIKCNMCSKQNKSTHSAQIDKEDGTLMWTDKWPASQKTVSKPVAFPSRLRDKRSNVQILTAEDRDTWATTSKTCPKCDHDRLKFRDVQTRGADEGSTIFYKCPACGHGFKEDN